MNVKSGAIKVLRYGIKPCSVPSLTWIGTPNHKNKRKILNKHKAMFVFLLINRLYISGAAISKNIILDPKATKGRLNKE